MSGRFLIAFMIFDNLSLETHSLNLKLQNSQVEPNETRCSKHEDARTYSGKNKKR